MQQPPPQMVTPSFPPANISTEQIQKYLDENKKLIMAILDNQNLGKLAECAQYQALLQKNLMYLAAIADAQPQTPTLPPQMALHPSMQQGGYYMQHPQAAAMAQQPGLFPPKGPIHFNNPHQIHEQQQQQQQTVQGQMSLRPGGGMHPMHTENTMGGGSSGAPPSNAGDVRGGSVQVGSEAATIGADGHGGGDGESSMKGSEDSK